jgi:hypothetical protein
MVQMMCLMKRILPHLLILLIGYSAVASADTLMMPGVNSQPSNSSDGVIRPERGLSMDEVQTQFGKPTKIDGPVGKPPITRWTYAKFTVVFEDRTVIDSFVEK